MRPTVYATKTALILGIVFSSVTRLRADEVSRKDSASAGIKTKDVIVKINDQPVAHQTMFAIRKLLSVEGDKVSMTIRRGNERLDVVFSQGRRNFTPATTNRYGETKK